MTMAIRMYFWPEAMWVPQPPVVVVPDVGTGGGARPDDNHEYWPTDESFWLIREEYLKRLHEKHNPPPPRELLSLEAPPTTNLTNNAQPLPNLPPRNLVLPPTFDAANYSRYKAELSTAIELASGAVTFLQLKQHAARVAQLQALTEAALTIRRKERNKRILRLQLFALALALALN